MNMIETKPRRDKPLGWACSICGYQSCPRREGLDRCYRTPAGKRWLKRNRYWVLARRGAAEK